MIIKNFLHINIWYQVLLQFQIQVQEEQNVVISIYLVIFYHNLFHVLKLISNIFAFCFDITIIYLKLKENKNTK